MIDFEFCIDTGNSPPVFGREPVYGFYESKIMTKLIADLEAINVITDCEGVFESLILFEENPHQEGCTDIKAFIWRLCVSYRLLNGITLGLKFPITRCVDSIEDLGDSCGPIFIISLDAQSGYHQISFRKCDREELAFFTLSGERR